MKGTQVINLTVNGSRHTLGVAPESTLKQILREELGLTGTKSGCDAGDCGACTVLLNGRAVTSCLVLAATVDGAEVRTIEGLADGNDLHPLQKSFLNHGAVQCGFCTSGMLMSCIELLEKNPTPSEEEIKTALAGNLCRCGTYPRIIAAIQDWQNFVGVELDTEPGPHAESDQSRDHVTVGKGVTRYDGPDKVTGRLHA